MKSNIEKINNFLDGDMSFDERNDFLKELKNNASLKSDLEKYEKINSLLKSSAVEQTTDDFTSIIMQKINRKGRIIKQQKHYLIAIYTFFGLIVAAILGYMFYNLFSTQITDTNSTTSFLEIGKNIKSYIPEIFGKKSISIFGSVLALVLIISSYLLYDQRKIKHTN